MSNFTKIFLVIFLILIGLYVKDIFFNGQELFNIKMPNLQWNLKNPFNEEKITDNTKKIDVVSEKEVEQIAKKEDMKPQEMVIVYFMSMDPNGNSWFSKSIRPLPEGQTKISYAIKCLIKGPLKGEKTNGIYSEIPADTKLLKVKELPDKVIVDLSSDFQYGGGADSLYSRLKQLIKTSLANSKNKPVYLYIDGKQVNVIGGEGVMINQPLNENSLDE